MIRRNAGFTIVELLISVAIVGFVLAAAATFFVMSVKQYKVQTKITETNVEGVLGLELLRRDLESMGFGLPWNNLSSYTETSATPLNSLNDTPNAPRAAASIDCAANTVNNSDYLTIKSSGVGMDDAAGKWTTLSKKGIMRSWNPSSENPAGPDYVIVLSLGKTNANRRSLVNPGTYYIQFGNLGTAAAYRPLDNSTNIVYAIGDTQPRRPFNRADYFIADESTTPSISVPQRCAPNTGVLVKAVVPHTDSGAFTELFPLLDCAADMQVVYGMDTNGDGFPETWSAVPPPAGPTAAGTIRAQLREIRISILAHEGQRDDDFTYQADNVTVATNVGNGNVFDVGSFKNYRWKVYHMIVRPWNLAQ